MIILRSFISALPGELEEAAIIDGATDFQVLLKVILPLTLPAIATLSLFYAVGKWNSFSDALYYISSASLQPLQLKLYNLIKGSTTLDISAVEATALIWVIAYPSPSSPHPSSSPRCPSWWCIPSCSATSCPA